MKNAYLTKLQAHAELNTRARLESREELSAIALLYAAHESLHFGPVRSQRLLKAYFDMLTKIADEVERDYGTANKARGSGDAELMKTKHDMAVNLKYILGSEGWEKYKRFFRYLEAWWDV